MTTSIPVLRLIEDGQPGQVLPQWTNIELGTDDGTASTLVLHYTAEHPTAALLVDQAEVVVMLDGQELADGRFVLDESASDEVIDEALVSWKGVSTLGELRYARVYPQSWPSLDEPNQPLDNVTPGFALRLLTEKAQDRGALAGITWDFTDTYDSAGQPWPKTVTEVVEAGKTYLEVVEAWHDRNLATARMTGGVLQLFAYSNHGTDRTADVQLLRGRDLLNGPVDTSSRDTVSTMLALSGSVGVERANNTALARYGRREGFLSQAQAPDEATLASIADGTMSLMARSRESYSYDLALHGFRPFTDFDRGDVVEVRVKGRDRVMRVRQLAVEWNADGTATGSVAFGDRYADAATTAQQRLEQLTSGSMDTGAYGSPMINAGTYPTGDVPGTPGEVGRDTVAPAAPTNVHVTNRAYLAQRGQFGAAVTIAWDPVERNVDGSTAEDLSYYSVQLFRHEPEWLLYSEWQPAGTIPPETTTTTLYPLDPNREYRIRVRATDWWGNNSGWTEHTFTTGQDTQPPTTPPASPGVEPALFGALRISWDGLDADGLPVEDDASHVEVHVSTTAQFTPDETTMRSTISVPAPGQSLDTIVTDLNPGTTYYVRLVLVDVWGNASEPGPQASGIPRELTAEPGDVGPENLTFADYGNLVPDGSFERPEYRTLLTAERFEESDTAGTWSPSSRGGFVHNTGDHVLLDADMTSAAAWRTREGPAPIVTGDGLAKDGTGHARWSTVAAIPFDPTALYKVSAQVRVERTSTSGGGRFYGAIESKTAGGAFINGNGADAWTFMQEAVASNRAQSAVGQWRTWTGYVRGTSAAPALREGPYNSPAPLPAGTGQFGFQTTLDFNGGNGRWTLGEVRIERPAPSVHGDWALQINGGGAAFQRAVLAEIDNPGADMQYYVRFWARLTGPRTTQPTVFAAAELLDEDGAFIPISAAPAKSGGWDHDGWYLIEGRFQRDSDAQYARVNRARLYVATAALAAGQTVQVDAVEIRQVATRVLIADAAIDDAKIASLSASKITAGTIQSVVTVSGRIATAETGARIELDSAGLRGYASNGSRTVSIDTATGAAQFTGYLGSTEVQGFVRASKDGAQIIMWPDSSFQRWNRLWPALVLSTGIAPWEKSPAYFTSTWDRTMREFYCYWRAPGMKLRGSPYPYGWTEMELTTTASGPNNATTGETEQMGGRLKIRFPAPLAEFDNGSPDRGLTGGGAAYIDNQWQYDYNPRQGPRPGLDIAFVGETTHGHKAGMVIHTDIDAPNAKDRVWIDFRRNAYWTSPNDGSVYFHDNWAYVGLRADMFVDMESNEHTKTDIIDMPFSAVDVVRSNPAKRWRRKRDEHRRHRFGPMSDQLPEGIAVTDETTGNRGISLDSAIGLLWRAIEETNERLDGLEGQ